MKIMTIVGARPNFMKAAPIIAAIDAHNRTVAGAVVGADAPQIHHVLVHTGQHYDEIMSGRSSAISPFPSPMFTWALVPARTLRKPPKS